MTMNYSCNQTVFYERPPEICIDNSMRLTQANVLSITFYSVLFVLSSICNLTMFTYLCWNKRYEQSRINKFMFHLNIADLLITFITIPIEAGWKYTVSWLAGDIGCRLFLFLRPIGNYLASFIVISLCIDRYHAIVKPLDLEYNAKTLISLSWLFSIVFSLPQIFVFSLNVHPVHKWYAQCVDFMLLANRIENPVRYRQKEILFISYQIFVSVITFFLPLLVIIISYSCILLKIIGKLNNKQNSLRDRGSDSSEPIESMQFSSNRNATIKKAKKKTLKLAILIVIVFMVSWTPYYAISVVFWIHPEFANRLDNRIYNSLFIFAVSNCLANPLVYGLTSIKIGSKNKTKFNSSFRNHRNINKSNNLTNITNLTIKSNNSTNCSTKRYNINANTVKFDEPEEKNLLK